MIVEVYRGAGDKSGPAIIEPLLSNDALIHRGTAEIDANAHQFNRVSLSVVPRPGLRLGQIVEVSDPTSATPYRGKIVGIQLLATRSAVEQSIEIEVPL